MKNIMDKYDKCDFELLLKKTAFSRDVALLLYEEGTLSHGQLCEKLNKTKQNLSNAINRIEPFDVLNTRKIGKNVYYSLTYKGNKFVVYIKKEIELKSL